MHGFIHWATEKNITCQRYTLLCTVNTNMNKIVSVPEGFIEWFLNSDDYCNKISCSKS